MCGIHTADVVKGFATADIVPLSAVSKLHLDTVGLAVRGGQGVAGPVPVGVGRRGAVLP